MFPESRKMSPGMQKVQAQLRVLTSVTARQDAREAALSRREDLLAQKEVQAKQQSRVYRVCRVYRVYRVFRVFTVYKVYRAYRSGVPPSPSARTCRRRNGCEPTNCHARTASCPHGPCGGCC